MRRARSGLVLALLAAFAPVRVGQEPPPVEGGEGGQEEQEKKDDEKQEEKEEKEEQQTDQGERQDPEPAPAPEGQEPPSESVPPPVPAETAGAGAAAPGSSAPASEPPRPARPAVVWPLDAAGIALHLRGIAETHPTVAALEVLGHSRSGLEILALRLGVREEQPGGAKPVLLLIDSQGVASAGPEAMLELAWVLAGEFESDERVRALLTRTTLVLAPALDPDARASVTPGGASDDGHAAVRFERNFPSGWQPESVRAGSGRVPLSQPETMAAARFLTNLDGCAVLLGFASAAPRGVPYPGAELPAADREVFLKLGAALELEGASALVPWFELGTGGGALADFAYQARGIYPLFFTLPAEEELAAGGLAAFRAQLVARVERCLSLLPRVEVAQEGLERLASDTWQLDVRIQNVGIVPTSSALARHRDAPADVSMRLEGAKLVATARKPQSNAPYTDASFQVRTPLSGGTLAGGEGRWLRLFLEAASGTEVRVTASSPWAGSSAVVLTLP